jgi:predicted RNA-binding protein YlqC (UPF0109 family)
MKDALEYIIASIVDDPDAVVITEDDSGGFSHFIVTVAKDDMGKVIGREGKVIRSIRNIMKIKAMKQGARFSITLAETSPDEEAAPIEE